FSPREGRGLFCATDSPTVSAYWVRALLFGRLGRVRVTQPAISSASSHSATAERDRPVMPWMVVRLGLCSGGITAVSLLAFASRASKSSRAGGSSCECSTAFSTSHRVTTFCSPALPGFRDLLALAYAQSTIRLYT